MKTVVAVYTGRGLADLLTDIARRTLPNVRFVNLVDENIIGEVGRAGGLDDATAARLLRYYAAAETLGADLILNTCSSVGEAVYKARETFKTPILRIDEPMAREAVQNYRRIAVIATLRTTLEPTLRLLKREAAAQGRKIEAVEGLAQGAFEALIGGSPEKHDELILETAKSLAPHVDCIVLAQGSMARMEAGRAEKAGVPVLSSPRRAIDEIGRLLAE